MGLTEFPPEPWDLHGHAHVGVWLLPRGQAPAPHSAATRPITLFGRTVVAAAFFRYDAPSPLTYDEIMSTVLVRDGLRPRVSITHIWVDSEASRAGGRTLWAIPKQMATFERDDQRRYLAHGIGSLRLGRRPRRSIRLPFGVPVRFRIAQDRDGTLVTSPVSGSTRLSTALGDWSFDPDGPLKFLVDRRPVLTVSLVPFRLVFGRRRS